MLEIDVLLIAIDGLLVENHKAKFGGEPFACGHMPYCDYCISDTAYSCAKAFLHYQGERKDIPR